MPPLGGAQSAEDGGSPRSPHSDRDAGRASAGQVTVRNALLVSTCVRHQSFDTSKFIVIKLVIKVWKKVRGKKKKQGKCWKIHEVDEEDARSASSLMGVVYNECKGEGGGEREGEGVKRERTGLDSLHFLITHGAAARPAPLRTARGPETGPEGTGEILRY